MDRRTGPVKGTTASRRPLGKALRAAIVVTAVAVVVNTIVDLGSSGFYAVFGVFILLVLADFGGPTEIRFWAYLATGAAGLALITVGALAATTVPTTLLVTAIVAFALAYAVVLRGYVGTAYLCLLLPYIVAVTTPQPIDTLLTSLAAYTGGTLVAAIAAVTLWPSHPASAIREAVGRSLSAAAELVTDLPPLGPGAKRDREAAATRELAAANHALADAYDGKLARPGDLTGRDRGLVQLVNDMGRLRLALSWLAEKAAEPTRADRDLLRAVGDTLDSCGEAVSGGGALPASVSEGIFEARDRHIEGLPESADRLLSERKGDDLTSMVSAGFYLRITSFIAAMIVRHTKLALGQRDDEPGSGLDSHSSVETISMIESATSPVEMLRSNLGFMSPWFRRALQTSAAVTIAVAIIHAFHLTTGFWVVLGIVAALQLNAIRSRRSAWGAALGTIAGFVVCAILVPLVGSDTAALIALLPLVAFVTVWYPAGALELPLKQAGFTVWFVMLVSLSDHGMSMHIDEVRIVDVGTGLLTSLVITTLMWPRGVATQVRAVLDRSVRTTADFFVAAYGYITSPMTDADGAEVRRAAQGATAARIRAADAFDVAISEGGGAGVSATAWSSVANSVDHVFFAATMVRGLEDYGLAPIPDPDVAEGLCSASRRVTRQFADGIDASLELALAGEGAERAEPALDADPRPPHDGGSHELADLREAVERAVDRCDGRSGELRFRVPPRAFSTSYGKAAVSMLWAQDWLLYFDWMAAHTKPETGDDKEGPGQENENPGQENENPGHENENPGTVVPGLTDAI